MDIEEFKIVVFLIIGCNSAIEVSINCITFTFVNYDTSITVGILSVVAVMFFQYGVH